MARHFRQYTYKAVISAASSARAEKNSKSHYYTEGEGPGSMKCFRLREKNISVIICQNVNGNITNPAFPLYLSQGQYLIATDSGTFIRV